MDVVETFRMAVWIACAAGAALLRGLTPVWMRAGAKRSDPSFAAAVFATVLLFTSVLPLMLSGGVDALLSLGNRSLLLSALAGLIAAFSYLCLFTALTGAGATRVIPIVNLTSVIVLVLAHVFLGGRLGIWRMCLIVLILLGTVLLESRGGAGGSARWLLYAVLALLARAALELLTRKHLTAVPGAAVLCVRSGVAAALLWAFALARGKQKTARAMGAAGWISIPLAAICVGLAQACDAFGAGFGEWSWLAPIGCLGFVTMLLMARIILKEKLPGSAVFGALLVILGEFAILMGF